MWYIYSFILLQIIILWLGIKTIPKGYVGVIERAGTYHRQLPEGRYFIIPVLDKLKKRVNVFPQKIVLTQIRVETIDNTTIDLIPIIDFQVINPLLCVYGAKEPQKALAVIIEKGMFKRINKDDFEKFNHNIEEVCSSFINEFKEKFESVGINITNLTLKKVIE